MPPPASLLAAAAGRQKASPQARFLREGDVGILITPQAGALHAAQVTGVQAKGDAMGEAPGRLLALSRRLISEGLHGLTLLHVARGGSAYAELVAKLGAASPAVRDTIDVAVEAPEGRHEAFMIVRLAGSRFAEVRLLQEPKRARAVSSSRGGRSAHGTCRSCTPDDEALYRFSVAFLAARHGWHGYTSNAEDTAAAWRRWATELVREIAARLHSPLLARASSGVAVLAALWWWLRRRQ